MALTLFPERFGAQSDGEDFCQEQHQVSAVVYADPVVLPKVHSRSKESRAHSNGHREGRERTIPQVDAAGMQ